MEVIESKPENPMEEANDDADDDYDIEFCDDTDVDDDGDIITQKDTHSSSLFSSMSEKAVSKENYTSSQIDSETIYNTKLHSFKILDIEIVYKLCSTTVLFKTETVLRLIQVSNHESSQSFIIPNKIN